jgi:hypothetical protein
MPALEHLQERMSSEPEWREMYENNLEQARRVAEKMPLVHVSGNPERAISFEDLILHPPHEIPTSEDTDYYSESTRSAEDTLDLRRCAYFYAGQPHPDFGNVALAFDPSCEATHTGTATPFDTGGLAGEHIDSNLPDRQPETLRAFTQASMEPLEGWRQAFRQFLSAYFLPISDYWSGRPCQPDPDDLFVRNDDWRAWTFEVRFHEGQNIFDAMKWCPNKAYSESVGRALKRLSLTAGSVSHQTIAQFQERKLDVDEISQDHCETIEKWVQSEVDIDESVSTQ